MDSAGLRVPSLPAHAGRFGRSDNTKMRVASPFETPKKRVQVLRVREVCSQLTLRLIEFPKKQNSQSSRGPQRSADAFSVQ